MNKHLITIEDLDNKEVEDILALGNKFFESARLGKKKFDSLKGKTVINLFFENSTRTRTSFEIAGKRLGADVINISVDSSSAKKGETIKDTVLTLQSMSTDFMVIRHSASGIPEFLASFAKDMSIINAGDGCHQHPTQALLDLFTIKQNKKKIAGLKIVICGDVLHSRVARSNAMLLSRMGAEVTLCAPSTLMPKLALSGGIKMSNNLSECIGKADVVMMLRLQKERMNGSFLPSVREYFELFGLDRKKLSMAANDVLIMHPGPMNRGVEISSEVADDNGISLILYQVESGVAVRQAILEFMNNSI